MTLNCFFDIVNGWVEDQNSQRQKYSQSYNKISGTYNRWGKMIKYCA
jgi:hypothetical protein